MLEEGVAISSSDFPFCHNFLARKPETSGSGNLIDTSRTTDIVAKPTSSSGTPKIREMNASVGNSTESPHQESGGIPNASEDI